MVLYRPSNRKGDVGNLTYTVIFGGALTFLRDYILEDKKGGIENETSKIEKR
jgi:hypothetical protein